MRRSIQFVAFHLIEKSYFNFVSGCICVVSVDFCSRFLIYVVYIYMRPDV